MKIDELKYLISADLFRYSQKKSILSFILTFIKSYTFKTTFYYRINRFLFLNHRIFLSHLFYYFILRRWNRKTGVQIHYKTNIGAGLFIVHYGGIVINHNAVIGKNLTICHNVTIGQINRGTKKGNPVIDDNVYIAPGAAVMGSVKIKSNAVVGTNSVVTTDVPESAVVVGQPAKMISLKGAKNYVDNTGY